MILYFLIAFIALYIGIGGFLYVSMAGAHQVHRVLFGAFWPLLVLVVIAVFFWDLFDRDEE